MNVTELCRNNLYARAGISTQKKRDPIKVQAEISGMQRQLRDAIALAEPRLIMGGIRYGSEWEHDALMDYIDKKIKQFRDTGDSEMLIDVINLCVVEMRLKTHPAYHFNGEDRE